MNIFEDLIEFSDYKLNFYKSNKKAVIYINIACIFCILIYVFNIFSVHWLYIIPAVLYLNAVIVLSRALKLTKENINKTEKEISKLKEVNEKLDKLGEKDE